MQVAQITLKLAAAEARAAAPLRLEVGSEVVARLVSSPSAGGRGLISLAGHLLEAQLPPGLEPGRTLPLRVVRADPSQVVVRIIDDSSDGKDKAAAQRLAGELALRGDGDLMRAALNMAAGTLWLPGGSAADVTVDPDAADGEGDDRASSGEAGFVLHDPVLGAIEVRLRLGPGGVQAAVTTPPGVLTDRASRALPELIDGLTRATGRPAAAAVAERPPASPPPPPPQGAVDVHA